MPCNYVHMNEEINIHASRMPEFDAVSILQQRLANKKSDTSSINSSNAKTSFDPHQIMVNRRRENAGEITANTPVQSWPEHDIQTLESFCKQYGIMGFNCGNMSPIAALALLKNKLGIIDNIPHSENYTSNYPYTEAMKKKILLRG